MSEQDEKSESPSKDDGKFVRILAYDEDGQGESFWARSLGDSLYEVQNIVMSAPGLHPEDVVRCIEPEDTLPEVVEVVHRSQVRSILVIFSEQATVDQIVDVLWALAKMGVPFEKATDRVIGLGVRSEIIDFDKVIEVLEANKQLIEEYDELD